MSASGNGASSASFALHEPVQRGGAPADTSSGRSFVLVLLLLLAILAVALMVAFRQWKDRHTELSVYGAQRVAPAILPLTRKPPQGVPAQRWTNIVEAMRAVLEGVTGSGLLDLKDMQALRRDVQLRVDAARPETSAEALALLWRDLERRAGPTLVQHPILGLSSSGGRLDGLRPDGIDRATWTLAVLETRAMLVSVASSQRLSKSDLRQLREAVDAHLADATNKNARQKLSESWTMVAGKPGLPAGFSPPEVARNSDN